MPDVILDAFMIDSKHEFVCEIKRHFDKDKKLIHEVNETAKFSSHGHGLPSGRILELAETPVAQKYGFACRRLYRVGFHGSYRKKEKWDI